MNAPRISAPLLTAAAAVLVVTLAGCSRDTRVNSDPGPGRPSQADGGTASVKNDPNAAPSASGTSATTGTDSTGRPSSSSGGVTAGGSGSGTSGTQTEPKRETGR